MEGSNDSGQGRSAPPDFLARAIAAKEAAWLAGVHTDTIARWCVRHHIGRQLHGHGRWDIDPVGLAIVLAKDSKALDAYQRRDLADIGLQHFIMACRTANAFSTGKA